MSAHYYDRRGNPISWEGYVQLLHPEEQRVALHQAAGVEISTVWLGINHQFGDGPPLIFETMIFEDGPLDNECWRYSTEAEALAGHQAAIKHYEEAVRNR